jgi:hypothetical protein
MFDEGCLKGGGMYWVQITRSLSALMIIRRILKEKYNFW